jgi:hypothetical protein
VFRLLTDEQKQIRVDASQELLNRASKDETLLYIYIKTLLLEMRHGFMDTMLKQKLNHHNGCQKGHQDQRKQDKCGQTLKVILTVVFDSEGVFHHEFLPQDKTLTKEYYLEVLKRLRVAIRKK